MGGPLKQKFNLGTVQCIMILHQKKINFLAIVLLLNLHIVYFYFEQIKSLSGGSSGEAVSGNPPVM